MTSELLDEQGQIPEIKNLFEEAAVKAVIKKANPQSAAGSSGLRYSHLQAALYDELVEGLAAFATLLFSSRVLPQVFWTLHTSANPSTLGQNARPVACGDVLRRAIGAVFCHRYGTKLSGYFQPWGQHDVAVSGEVEIMALTATLGFEEGCNILSYDGVNAFNGIYRHSFLPALAEIVPSVVPYASNCTHNPRNSSLHLTLEVWKWLSQCGEYNNDAVQALFATAGSLKILKEFRASPTNRAKSESGFVHRQLHGHSATGNLSRHGSYRECHGMTAGMPGGRGRLVEPKKITGPASRWSWARTPDGRGASGNG